MKTEDARAALEAHRIQPSAQRLAVAEVVLDSTEHLSADEILARAQRRIPAISRATVYNTLATMVERRLVRSLVLTEGRVVFDPNTERHHHFIDEDTGRIHDIPWNALEVRGASSLPGLEVTEYGVVLRGRMKKRSRV
ncbi:MAG: transcriptional repressor [Deltaproteobacteria bacterium]|nr:transcriptional repressor [Deltaproteobacteria bacterium]